jgi:hypothetical protein
MNTLPAEAMIVLIGAPIVALLWLAIRFGKRIARTVLHLCILAGAIILAVAMLSQAGASRQAAKAATEAMSTVRIATVGQSIGTVITIFALGSMGMVTAGALGAAGVFWLRWRLALYSGRAGLSEQRRTVLDRTVQGRQLPRRRRQRVLPYQDPLSFGTVLDRPVPFVPGHRTGLYGTVPKDQGLGRQDKGTVQCQRTEGPPEVVYILEERAEPINLDGLDLEEWGW